MKTKIAAIAAATLMMTGVAASAAPIYADAVYIDAGAGQSVGNSLRFGPDNALGAADGDFYSLGVGGGALFTFGTDILGPGAVYEVTWNCKLKNTGLCGNYPETAEIYGLNGPLDLAGLEDGTVGGVQNYDLTGLSLTFIDTIYNGTAQGGFAFDTSGLTFAGLFIRDISTKDGDGFDVASISATPAPVPLPPAAALLLAGVGGLGFAGRRRA